MRRYVATSRVSHHRCLPAFLCGCQAPRYQKTTCRPGWHIYELCRLVLLRRLQKRQGASVETLWTYLLKSANERKKRHEVFCRAKRFLHASNTLHMAGVQYTLHDDRSHLSKDIKKKNSNVQLSATKKRLILHQEQQQQHLFFSQNIRQCI